ncbi:AlkA N-terminal domain-containing protein [Colwellia asteriadis]|uniref:DNA-3-methyladenine glycosylase II n=1 Tax=Colwellia asteriadis TaxID=517723 RepID=A0ABP3WIU7_9GAMM
MLNPSICQKARLSRDPRFDGKFFTAVKTTGIYCRTICPVYPPKEENVIYFDSAIECANAGFRPCLRCRPDSAPGSPAWQGASTTFKRAIQLINEGALQTASLVELASRLGISDRYLRQLFNEHLGISPKAYALYQQCLFAKQLLHQTKLPITQVALASGFSSIRRFNDCFQAQLKLTPSQLRKSNKSDNKLLLKLHYRPPFNWPLMQQTLAARAIEGMEWCTSNSYGRTFTWQEANGSFTAKHVAAENIFLVTITLDDFKYLKSVVTNIRRILDVDVDMQAVEHDLAQCPSIIFPIKSGIRLPGIWSMFEAGIRAILGQQVSVTAARNLVASLVHHLSEPTKSDDDNIIHYWFPSALAIAKSDLGFLKIPTSRKQTLRNLAQYFIDCQHIQDANDADQWLTLKGIGPWTVAYAKMRGLSDPNIFLAGDLGVKKAQKGLTTPLEPEQASPWQSYLTFQLWSQLHE